MREDSPSPKRARTEEVEELAELLWQDDSQETEEQERDEAPADVTMAEAVELAAEPPPPVALVEAEPVAVAPPRLRISMVLEVQSMPTELVPNEPDFDHLIYNRETYYVEQIRREARAHDPELLMEYVDKAVEKRVGATTVLEAGPVARVETAEFVRAFIDDTYWQELRKLHPEANGGRVRVEGGEGLGQALAFVDRLRDEAAMTDRQIGGLRTLPRRADYLVAHEDPETEEMEELVRESYTAFVFLSWEKLE